MCIVLGEVKMGLVIEHVMKCFGKMTVREMTCRELGSLS